MIENNNFIANILVEASGGCWSLFTIISQYTASKTTPGGYSGYILLGVCPGTPKKGGLRCGHSPKRGVLGAGTAPKKGGLRCGHNQKKGGLRHVYNPKKGEFRTDLVRSCSKGGLGSLFMYYLYFYLTI